MPFFTPVEIQKFGKKEKLETENINYTIVETLKRTYLDYEVSPFFNKLLIDYFFNTSTNL